MDHKDKELINVLIFKKFLSADKLDDIAKEQNITGDEVSKILTEKKLITPEQLAEALADQYDIPYIKLSTQKIASQIIKLVPEDVAKEYKAVPVKLEEDELYVAFVSPVDLPARDEIGRVTGFKISPMIATEEEVRNAIKRYYQVQETSKQPLIDIRMKRLKDKKIEQREVVDQGLIDTEDLPMVKLVNDILNGAVTAGSSDIHFEPQDPEMVIRYRVDGILHDTMTIPKNIEESVVSRIKIMANLNITERRLPQDGHISFKRDNKEYDLRVSTVLTVSGEKIVLRILDKESMLMDLESLGFDKNDEQIFKELISKPYGMLLVTGPTGSGKTTTLYAVLKMLNSITENIVTIENPVEYRLNRINQIQVDPSSKITFATGLKTILRQDPDKIMIGEIRDHETAEIAVQAALTGHLVLSTLHTNDAASAVTRAVDMGMEPFLISSTVIGALAQRLCRKICPKCKEEYIPSKEEIESIGLELPPGAKLAKGQGCDYCYNTGYRGRTAVFEVMRMSEKIRSLILEKAPVSKIKEVAIAEGMNTLQQSGIKKVLDKVSTVEEVKRVVYVG